MKDIRPALRTWLLADGAISALVGGSRVYPLELPQGQRSPSLVYSRISEAGDYHTLGPSGLIQTRVQIDAWSQLIDLASELADAVKDRMDEANHITVSLGSPDSLTIQGAFMITIREDYDAEADLRRVSRDYFVWFNSL